jgi:peptidoglycan LD-endopeptidase LytH
MCLARAFRDDLYMTSIMNQVVLPYFIQRKRVFAVPRNHGYVDKDGPYPSYVPEKEPLILHFQPHYMKTFRKITFHIILWTFVAGCIAPQMFSSPIDKMTKGSYSQQSYWAYPWGTSVTHKGVDIFAKAGTLVKSTTPGIVVFTGNAGKGGNAVLVLGPKWRLHSYAHLKEIKTTEFSLLGPGSIVGLVGNTGNAKNTPAHLHYSIMSLIPRFWDIDKGHHGNLKMFYVNPIPSLNKLF